MRDPESALLVAERAGTCGGYGECGDRGHGPESFRLYVRPDHWHRGIGSSLLGALEERLADGGAERAHLFVHRDNEVGRAFWSRQGYERWLTGDREEAPDELCLRKRFG